MRLRIALATLIALASGCLESPPGGLDGGAEVDGAVDPFDCPGNLVVNPSFEDGTANWSPVHATVTLVGDAPLGSMAAEVCSDGTGEPLGYYSLDDMPQSVPDPVVGEQYEVSASVRAGPELGPQTVDVVLRASDEVYVPILTSQTPMTPDDQWRRATARLTVETEAADNVDVYVASVTPAEGNCFQVDALCLQRLPEETVTR